MEIVLKKLDEIEKKINLLDDKINNLNSKIDIDIANNCEKMGNHIDFIENVYNKLKYPLEFVSNKISFKKEKLPEINHKNKNELI